MKENIMTTKQNTATKQANHNTPVHKDDKSANQKHAPNPTGKQTSDKSSAKGKSSDAKGSQGFASMSKERVREIASKGGKSSHSNTNTTSGR